MHWQGEKDSCLLSLKNGNKDSCTLDIAGEPVHVNVSGSRNSFHVMIHHNHDVTFLAPKGIGWDGDADCKKNLGEPFTKCVFQRDAMRWNGAKMKIFD